MPSLPYGTVSSTLQPRISHDGAEAGGDEGGGDTTPAYMSVGVIVVMVLGVLCAILGAIYAYIYFTRINPRTNRPRKYVESQGGDDGDGGSMHTHMFLFRKSWGRPLSRAPASEIIHSYGQLCALRRKANNRSLTV